MLLLGVVLGHLHIGYGRGAEDGCPRAARGVVPQLLAVGGVNVELAAPSRPFDRVTLGAADVNLVLRSSSGIGYGGGSVGLMASEPAGGRFVVVWLALRVLPLPAPDPQAPVVVPYYEVGVPFL